VASSFSAKLWILGGFTMRRLFAGVAAVACALTLGAPAFAETVTVKGQIVDQECYLKEKKVDANKACAVECAKSGKPMALLTADGKVYEITGRRLK